MKTKFILIFLLLLVTGAARAAEPDWAPYTKALKTYVKDGSVNYTGLRADQGFKTFMVTLRKFDRSKLATKDEKKAFYINLYNALTLELIINNKPVTSIKKIGSPWSKKVYTQGGQTLTLDNIEHDILRPMGDYRIHFAINCASISCPTLSSEAYTAGKLNAQLSHQMAIFLADTNKGVKVVNGKATVSKIFDWFSEDFGGKGGVLQLIQSRHTKGSEIKGLNGYLEYNWNLNGR